MRRQVVTTMYNNYNNWCLIYGYRKTLLSIYGEDRCVTTLITAAKETNDTLELKLIRYVYKITCRRVFTTREPIPWH